MLRKSTRDDVTRQTSWRPSRVCKQTVCLRYYTYDVITSSSDELVTFCVELLAKDLTRSQLASGCCIVSRQSFIAKEKCEERTWQVLGRSSWARLRRRKNARFINSLVYRAIKHANSALMRTNEFAAIEAVDTIVSRRWKHKVFDYNVIHSFDPCSSVKY